MASKVPVRSQPQAPSLLDALVPVLTLVVLLGLSYYLFGEEAAAGLNQIALIFCTMVAVLVAVLRGHAMESLRDAAIASVNTGLYAIFIPLAVGANILAADQYIAIVLPGRMFRQAFRARGLAPPALSPRHRRFGDGHLGTRALEQLRRLHGRHTRHRLHFLRALLLLQPAEPARHPALRRHRLPHAESRAGQGGVTPASQPPGLRQGHCRTSPWTAIASEACPRRHPNA